MAFSLDDSPDDARWYSGTETRALQATVIFGQARHHLMKELNEKGCGRGFLPIPDGEDDKAFIKAMDEPDSGYSTEQYVDVMLRSIAKVLTRKKGHSIGILVIDAPISAEYMREEVVNSLPDLLIGRGLAIDAVAYLVNRDKCIRLS